MAVCCFWFYIITYQEGHTGKSKKALPINQKSFEYFSFDNFFAAVSNLSLPVPIVIRIVGWIWHLAPV